MGRIILLVAVAIFMVGCESIPTTKIVKVPIIICPIPEYIVEPELAIKNLKTEDKGDWEKIAKSYAATVITQEAYIQKLKAQLQVYRDKRGEQ